MKMVNKTEDEVVIGFPSPRSDIHGKTEYGEPVTFKNINTVQQQSEVHSALKASFAQRSKPRTPVPLSRQKTPRKTSRSRSQNSPDDKDDVSANLNHFYLREAANVLEFAK